MIIFIIGFFHFVYKMTEWKIITDFKGNVFKCLFFKNQESLDIWKN